MARRWWPSHLVLVAGAAYLLLISLKFRRVLNLAATDPAFSSPSSSDHLPPHLGSSPSNPTATPLFQVQPFWHRYDRVSLPDIAARNRSALDRMVDDAWALGLTAWEDSPRILHLNPRLRGDWSQRPIIEHNTCYRMQWGAAQRCDGSPPEDNEDKG